MAQEHRSQFAASQSKNKSALLDFLEKQTEVLGAVDRQLIWDCLQGRANLRVIDFGCGDGSYLESLVTGAPEGMFAGVCGIDVNADWITVAQQRPHGIPAEFQLGNVCQPLGFSDGQFDVVLSRFTLISAEEPQSAMRNAFRILAAGGRFIAIESCYGVAQAINTSPAMLEFCERLTSWYRRAGSSPYLGPHLWQGMRQEGFRVQRDLVVIYGNNTLGSQTFAQFKAMTARNLGAVFQDIFPDQYCETPD